MDAASGGEDVCQESGRAWLVDRRAGWTDRACRLAAPGMPSARSSALVAVVRARLVAAREPGQLPGNPVRRRSPVIK